MDVYCDDASLQMFYERREAYLNGEVESYTVEEAFEEMRSQRNGK